ARRGHILRLAQERLATRLERGHLLGQGLDLGVEPCDLTAGEAQGVGRGGLLAGLAPLRRCEVSALGFQRLEGRVSVGRKGRLAGAVLCDLVEAPLGDGARLRDAALLVSERLAREGGALQLRRRRGRALPRARQEARRLLPGALGCERGHGELADWPSTACRRSTAASSSAFALSQRRCRTIASARRMW